MTKKNEATIIDGNTSEPVQQPGLMKFQAGGGLSKDTPAYLQQHAGNHEGQEAVGQEDLLIPRLAIAQEGNSPQLKKLNEAFIPGLEAGQFFNTVTSRIYGTKVLVVPMMFYKNFIQFKSMDDGGGVIAMYDSKDQVPAGGLSWKDGNKPEVTEFKNRISLLIQPDEVPELIAVSFKSSGMKAAKQWNSLINATNLPAYARSYMLETKLRVDGQKSWYVATVAPDRFVPEDFFQQAKAYFDSLQEGGFKVDTTGLDPDETEQSNDDGKTPF